MRSLLLTLTLLYSGSTAYPDTYLSCPPTIEPGRYEGPMEEYDPEIGGYRGTLIARAAKIKKDGSLVISPAGEAGFRRLVLRRIEDEHQLRWRRDINDTTRFIARGGRWSPNIYVISVMKKKGKKIVWGARYFFAPVKGK